jgi:undecaprenyl diphosphate synthase
MPSQSQDEQQYPPLAQVPQHVGIIMDGNGRWARARGLPRSAGHRAGTENLRRVLRAAVEFGVPILSIYAFSTENWSRPEGEVKALLTILEGVIDRELQELHEEGVQLRHVGRIERLPEKLQTKIQQAIDLTENNDKLILNVAFDYGGRAEIVDAIRRIITDGTPAEDVTEEVVSHYLYTAGLPDADLIVRTSGEMRISNFLIWQGAYAEYYVTPAMWPDFGRGEFHKALQAFNQRERRFGLVPK